MTLKHFIATFIGANTLIRLHEQTAEGHVQITKEPIMEWMLLTDNDYLNREVRYIKDILFTDSPEAVNIVLRKETSEA